MTFRRHVSAARSGREDGRTSRHACEGAAGSRSGRTAVVPAGVLGSGLWVFRTTSSTDSVPRPATRSGGQESGVAMRIRGAVVRGAARPDLAEPLGTPVETPKAASRSAGGRRGPAIPYTDRTLRLDFRLDGERLRQQPGALARVL
ncbi:DUF6215 domain-containing protein [Streptomyces sp. NPDC088194]|uniref:DUF6215 domain-containing protein n=1 Tax=Streptomyces sp. NPDC088194 TaxID=3154931 RepID=UPI00344EF10B